MLVMPDFGKVYDFRFSINSYLHCMTGRSLAVILMVFIAGCERVKSRQSDLFPVRTGDQYGFINRKGETVVPFNFSRAGCFAGGLALVRTCDNVQSWGYIDNSGNFLIPPDYVGGASFSEGYAFAVKAGSAPCAIDKNGIVQFTLDSAYSAESFCDGYAAFSVLKHGGELWGFADKNGKTVIEPQYVAVSFFSQGLCGVMNANGQWGYIDKDGTIIIDFLYNNALPFIGNRAKVRLNGTWGIVDKKGRMVLEPQFEDIDIDDNGYLIRKGNKWGWIDEQNHEVIDLQFSDAYPFRGNKFAAVKSGGKWGYINRQGKYLIAPQFDFAFGFDAGLAPVEVGGKYGFIDEAGKYIVDPTYDHLPVDYFIRYFTSASAFFSVKTNVERPDYVGYKWLSDFYQMNYEDAMLHSTADTKVLLREFSSVSDMIADSSRRSMAGILVKVKGVEQFDERAIVTYTLSDNKGVEQKLFLVHERGKWLVQFNLPGME